MPVIKGATESFILLAPALSVYAEELIDHLKASALRVEEQIRLHLSDKQCAQLLSIITEHSRVLPVAPASSTTKHFSLQALESFGSKEFNSHPSSPSIEDVETFSDGALTCIVVTSVDPRLDVVATVHALVGPDERALYDLAAARGAHASQHLPVRSSHAQAGRVALPDTLRFQFDLPDHARVWRVAAPALPSQAMRALQLVRRLRDSTVAGSQRQSSPGRRASTTSFKLPDAVTGTARTSSAVSREGLLSTLTRAGPYPLGSVQGKDVAVDVDTLLSFVFPHAQQYPNSTGRLLLVALYGPLTADGHLNGGRRGGRHASELELESMIVELEREDILAVYSAQGSVMGDIQALLTDLHAASRKLPRMSRDQVISMLSDLPRDGQERISFHDLQQRVCRARMERVRTMGKMFPDILAMRDKDARRLSLNGAIRPYGKGSVVARLREEGELGETIILEGGAGPAAMAATGGLGNYKAKMASQETHRLAKYRQVEAASGEQPAGSPSSPGGLSPVGRDGVHFAMAGSDEGFRPDQGRAAGGGSLSPFRSTYEGTGVRYTSRTAPRVGPKATHGPMTASATQPSVSAVAVGTGTGAPALFPPSNTFTRRKPQASKPAYSTAASLPALGYSEASHPVWTGTATGSRVKKISEVQRGRVVDGLLHTTMSTVGVIDDVMNNSKAIAAKASSLLVRPDIPSAKDGFDRFAPYRHAPTSGSYVPGALPRAYMQATRIVD